MFVDTHCHINMMVKKNFDTPLTPDNYRDADRIVHEATQAHVLYIVNVGTSVIESTNCIHLAQRHPHMYAAAGIHPNDCTTDWRNDLKKLATFLHDTKKNKIVAIGETGMDKHYPEYNAQRQKDAFKAQIELALEYDLALIVHTRDAHEETLKALDEFKGQIKRGVIHCYSEDQAFADQVIDQGFVLGIGGALTYPKNNHLRSIFSIIPLEKIVLETDAPFLPPQSIRGQQNHPKEIKTIAQFLADLRQQPLEKITHQTTANAFELFNIGSSHD
jgi:TatD DNase family protein